MSNEIDKIEQKVMSDIKSGKIKLRSKYIFLAEKLGVGSAVILTILLATLFFNLILFYLRESDNLGYLSFGSRGFFAFLESFPYLLVVGFIILIFVAGFIMKKSGVIYKKPFGYLALALTVFVVVTGTVLTFTNIAERIEHQSRGLHPAGRFIKPFFGPGPGGRNRGIVGRIVEIKGQQITIQTSRDMQIVDLSAAKDIPGDLNILDVGLFIMAVGERKSGFFRVDRIRIIRDPGEMSLFRQDVRSRFGEVKNCDERADCRLNNDRNQL